MNNLKRLLVALVRMEFREPSSLERLLSHQRKEFMKTSKPFSTISYNTYEFLKRKLDLMIEKGILEFYCFIHHQAEHNEAKQHYHVYFEPSRAIDTIAFSKEFIEIDPENPDKPLKIMPCQKSKWYDWLWYGLHDKIYLRQHYLERNFHYAQDSLVSYDENALLSRILDTPKPHSEIEDALEMIENGLSNVQICKALHVHLYKWKSVSNALYMLRKQSHQDMEDTIDNDDKETPF